MSDIIDVCSAVGKYQKDGEDKTEWLKLGAMKVDWDAREVNWINMKALPKVDENGEIWLKAFARKPRQRQNEPNW